MIAKYNLRGAIPGELAPILSRLQSMRNTATLFRGMTPESSRPPPARRLDRKELVRCSKV